MSLLALCQDDGDERDANARGQHGEHPPLGVPIIRPIFNLRPRRPATIMNPDGYPARLISFHGHRSAEGATATICSGVVTTPSGQAVNADVVELRAGMRGRILWVVAPTSWAPVDLSRSARIGSPPPLIESHGPISSPGTDSRGAHPRAARYGVGHGTSHGYDQRR
jgi:hypothetical protein